MARIRQAGAKRIGVYEIRCLENDKIYVGQSTNVYNRICNHKAKLRSGVHVNRGLSLDYNKYGESRFTFTILGYYDSASAARKAELELIDHYVASCSAQRLYNRVSAGRKKAKRIPVPNEDYSDLEEWANNLTARQVIAVSKYRLVTTGEATVMLGRHREWIWQQMHFNGLRMHHDRKGGRQAVALYDRMDIERLRD